MENQDFEEIKYRKINIYEASDILKEKEEFDKRKNLVERILKDNNIEYAFEMEDYVGQGVSVKSIYRSYCLNLIIKEQDLRIVEDLLYKDYEHEYIVIDEEENNDEMECNPIQDNEIEKESIESKDGVVNPGESFKENLNSLDSTHKMIAYFCMGIYVFFIMFELILIIDSGLHWGLLLAILIETFLIKKVLKGIFERNKTSE